MTVGGKFFSPFLPLSLLTNAHCEDIPFTDLCSFRRIAYMINENSVQFNIVSKHLGCERMAFFLNEAAGDIRDMMSATMPKDKAKL
jgi:hypothetical protein